MMTPPVTAPLQVELLAEPADPEFETNWVPGPDGMRAEIHGLPHGTIVHCIRLWDSSPQPVLLDELPLFKVFRAGDVLHLGNFPVN